MSVRKVTRFEFEDGTDVEFAPSAERPGAYEAWVNGVLIEAMEKGVRPSEMRAWYYHDVHGQGLAARVGVDSEPRPAVEVAAHVH